jgi:hypothetical protein
MDSSAYRYFIIELQQQSDDSFSLLPQFFLKFPVTLKPESFSSLQLFINSVFSHGGPENAELLPDFFSKRCNFFAGLFFKAHKALLDVLTGTDPQSHQFQDNGADLARFLAFCASSGDSGIISPADTIGMAMFCFLLEGLLYAGWCPDVFKGTAKRAAHSYFVFLKKTIHHLQTGHNAAVLGYMWGAWLLSQKTEDIRDNPFNTLSDAETFKWNIDGESQCYYARSFGTPPVICLIPNSLYEIPHPVFHISYRKKTGLSLFANNQILLPDTLKESSEIVRPRITGNKFVYKCRSEGFFELTWTIVFLFTDRTIYRIDVLKFPECLGPVTVQAEMRLENEVKLEEIKKGCFFGKGLENSVIRFVQDPLDFRLERQEESGISVFASGKGVFSGKEPIQLVCAWARGKGISTLTEIKLLGIFV